MPFLAFESLDFADDMPPIPGGEDRDTLRFAYTLPGREVIEVVKAVAATGSILPIAPSSRNASWTLEFTGPALQCANMSQPLRDAVRSNIANAIGSGQSCAAYGYVAWLEGTPFIHQSNTSEPDDSDWTFNSRIFQGSSMPARVYIAADPNAMTIDEHGASPAACNQPVEELYGLDEGAVMLQCELRTSRYETRFNYTNGIPDVSVNTEVLDDPPIQTVSSINCMASGETDGSCDFTPDTLRTLSYQAIMDACTYLITGYISAEQNSTSPFISTQVISIALISSPELDFLTLPILKQDSTSGARTLQQNLQSWTSTKDNGLVNTVDRAAARPLTETIEHLFQNATVSMMSQQHLQ